MMSETTSFWIQKTHKARADWRRQRHVGGVGVLKHNEQKRTVRCCVQDGKFWGTPNGSPRTCPCWHVVKKGHSHTHRPSRPQLQMLNLHQNCREGRIHESQWQMTDGSFSFGSIWVGPQEQRFSGLEWIRCTVFCVLNAGFHYRWRVCGHSQWRVLYSINIGSQYCLYMHLGKILDWGHIYMEEIFFLPFRCYSPYQMNLLQLIN